MADGNVAALLDAFTAWASAQTDVQAVVLAGSYARAAARPDSDIDLVLLVTEPAAWLDDPAWLHNSGYVLRSIVEEYGLVTSIRVWYDDGREVEYGITTPRWVALPLDAGTRRVLADGARVLFERGALVSKVL
jgi:hypothetical protein